MVCALCWLKKTTVTNKTPRIFFCGEPYIDIAQISGKLANPATRYYLCYYLRNKYALTVSSGPHG